MYTLPKKPQPILETITAGIYANLQYFSKILPFSIFLMLINLPQLFMPEAGEKLTSTQLWTQAGIFPFILIGTIIGSASLYYRVVSLVLEHKNLKLLNIFKIGLLRALPFVTVSIILGLLSLPGIAVIILAAKFLPIELALVFIALLTIPYFIYVYIKLAFALLLVSIPKKKILASLDESAKLVKHHFFRTAFSILLASVCVFIVMCVAAGIYFLSLGVLMGFQHVNYEHYYRTFLILVNPFSYQFVTVFLVVILNDLRHRKQAKQH